MIYQYLHTSNISPEGLRSHRLACMHAAKYMRARAHTHTHTQGRTAWRVLHDPVLWHQVDLTACSSCITDAAVDRILASAADIESLVLRPPASPPHLSWKLVQGLVATEACRGLRELRLDGCSGLLANTPKHLRPHISEAGVRCRIPAHLCFMPMLEDETEMKGEVQNGELDEGGGKVHKWLKGDQQPDVMYSTLFSQLVTDPSQILQEKMDEWAKIWKCNDDQARTRACSVIRKAIADAILAGDYDEASGDLCSGGQRAKAAGSFRRGTAVGSDS